MGRGGWKDGSRVSQYTCAFITADSRIDFIAVNFSGQTPHPFIWGRAVRIHCLGRVGYSIPREAPRHLALQSQSTELILNACTTVTTAILILRFLLNWIWTSLNSSLLPKNHRKISRENYCSLHHPSASPLQSHTPATLGFLSHSVFSHDICLGHRSPTPRNVSRAHNKKLLGEKVL